MPFPHSGLLLVLGAATIIIRILSQVEWWQRKEYRWDRVRSQLFSQEFTSLLSPLWVSALLAALLGWTAFFLDYSGAAEVLGVLSLLLIAAYDAWRTLRRGLLRPKPTAKGVLLLLVVAALAGVVAIKLRRDGVLLPLEVATLALGIVVVVPIGVWLVRIPVELRKKDIIAQAKKVRQDSKVVVLGITGSFGKTSTKFFLQQLLKDEPTAIATAEHRNAALPVAQDLLRQLKRDTRIYVVEMAAYRTGEIRDICEIVQPRLGLITAISNQHVALFGSLSALAAAKWELIDALPVGGTAILNADDTVIVERSRETRQRIIWFSASAKPVADHVDVFVSDVQIKPQRIIATLHVGAAQQRVTLPLVSQAMLGGAVAAAAAAYALGVPSTTIFRNIQQLVPFPRTMTYQRNSQGTVIIDDSYTANEVGVITAIKHLEQFIDMPKLVVLTPLIELGSAGPAVHRRIGAALASSGATVYATSALYHEALLKGGQEVTPKFSITVLSNPTVLRRAIEAVITHDTVVLLEGRLAEVVRQAVLK